MTPKQVLDAFSQTLMNDERILSIRERELLMSLLQNARQASIDAQTQSAVDSAIARSVGETVAQRAFTLLGGTIVEQILARSGSPTGISEAHIASMNSNPPGPLPPGAPKSPSGPQPPSGPADVPAGPVPPGISLRREPVLQVEQKRHSHGGGVAVLDSPKVVRAQSVILDEFLAPQEIEELMLYTLENQAKFRTSEVISPSGLPGTTDHSHRRSRVLCDLGKHEELILKGVRSVLPKVIEQLGMEDFRITQAEVQITASNDGDFFRAHCDNSQEGIASRRLTFVYFFHREPSQFDGGELRLHDATDSGGFPAAAGSYQTIVPQHNQIVFFPCSTLHEITAVGCRSRAFADSRFTVNGWLHR
jgi:Rps23 Pro-64 3,4-dihydroxylase Tpa1-like proline 4-hydroxylase